MGTFTRLERRFHERDGYDSLVLLPFMHGSDILDERRRSMGLGCDESVITTNDYCYVGGEDNLLDAEA